MKKFLNKSKDKKGFTMVELIVVIVIILVLAAVLVPSLLKYIEKANQANCKNDAATALVQLQADVADFYSTSTNKAGAQFTVTKIGNATNVKSAGISTTVTDKMDPGANMFAFEISTDEADRGDIKGFAYGNDKYYISWIKGTGWSEVLAR